MRGFLDKKICSCSNDDYTKFMKCCCSLEKGLLIWCVMGITFNMAVLALHLITQSVSFLTVVTAVFQFSSHMIGFEGARKEGKVAAHLLRLFVVLELCIGILCGFCFIVILGAVVVAWQQVGQVMTYFEVEAGRGLKWILVFEMARYGLHTLFYCFFLYFLISSAESLAKQKEGTELPLTEDPAAVYATLPEVTHNGNYVISPGAIPKMVYMTPEESSENTDTSSSHSYYTDDASPLKTN